MLINTQDFIAKITKSQLDKTREMNEAVTHTANPVSAAAILTSENIDRSTGDTGSRPQISDAMICIERAHRDAISFSGEVIGAVGEDVQVALPVVWSMSTLCTYPKF